MDGGMTRFKVLVIHPPSPPGVNIARDFAGGYGTAITSGRTRYGTDPGYMPVPYVSLLYVASALEKLGFEVRFVDGQAEDLTPDDVCGRLTEFEPSLIVGVINLPSLQQDLEFYRALRSCCGNEKTFFCAVGTVCRGVPEDVFAGNVFSAAVCADPEVVVPELAQCLEAGSNWREVEGITFPWEGDIKISAAAPRLSSLDQIGLPAYHLAPMHKYAHALSGEPGRYALVLSAKGCAGRCSYYCPYPFGFGRRIIYKSPENVIQEIEILAKNYAVTDLLFRDQTFTLNRTHAEAICDRLIARDLGVAWLCETRFDCVDRNLLEKMKAAGCFCINFGLESADAEVFRTLGKPGCTPEQAEIAVDMARNIGIDVHLHTIVGWPDDRADAAGRLIRLLKRLSPERVGVSTLTPYPGTPLRQAAIKEGLIETSDWSCYTGFKPVMRTRHLSLEEIAGLRDSVMRHWNDRTPVARIAEKVRLIAGMALARYGASP